jgi:hypothetical protein
MGCVKSKSSDQKQSGSGAQPTTGKSPPNMNEVIKLDVGVNQNINSRFYCSTLGCFKGIGFFPLELTTFTNENRICDSCGKTCEGTNLQMYSCPKCNYDVCLACRKEHAKLERLEDNIALMMFQMIGSFIEPQGDKKELGLSFVRPSASPANSANTEYIFFSVRWKFTECTLALAEVTDNFP